MKTLVTFFASLALASLLSVTSQAIEVGDKAPSVQLINIVPNGAEAQQAVNEPLIANQKVLLEFFSTTCSYCEMNLPKVKAMQELIGDKATFRHVGLDRNEAALRQFASENKDLLVALDNNREAKKAYGIYGTPTTVIIGTDNTVQLVVEGVWDTEVTTKIQDLLTQ